MIRAPRRSLIRSSCHYSSKAEPKCQETSLEPAKSFLRRNKPYSPSRKRRHTVKVASLPRVPVLSTSPRTIRLDAFFAGARPLLQVTIAPNLRLQAKEPTEPNELQCDYEAMVVGQPDSHLPNPVKNHLAELKPFQAHVRDKEQQANLGKPMASAQKLSQDILPNYQQDYESFFPPMPTHAVAEHFLDTALARLQEEDRIRGAAAMRFLERGQARVQAEGSLVSKPESASSASAPPGGMLSAVTNAIIKLFSSRSDSPVQVTQMRHTQANGKEGLVIKVSVEQDNAVPNGTELKTVTDLLSEHPLPQEFSDQMAEDDSIPFLVQQPQRPLVTKQRIALGPRALAKRGGRAVPRLCVRQLIVRMDSVKRKRRKKMSKHKYKKRRKATRAQRKKLGK